MMWVTSAFGSSALLYLCGLHFSLGDLAAFREWKRLAYPLFKYYYNDDEPSGIVKSFATAYKSPMLSTDQKLTAISKCTLVF